MLISTGPVSIAATCGAGESVGPLEAPAVRAAPRPTATAADSSRRRRESLPSAHRFKLKGVAGVGTDLMALLLRTGGLIPLRERRGMRPARTGRDRSIGG